MDRSSKSVICGNGLHLRNFVAWSLVLGTVFGFSCMPAFAQTPAQPPPHPQQHPGLPAGPGKDTLIRVCSKCHSPDRVIADGQSREGWENTISKMASLGATGSDDDFNDILDYLVKNFPAPSKTKTNENNAVHKN